MVGDIDNNLFTNVQGDRGLLRTVHTFCTREVQHTDPVYVTIDVKSYSQQNMRWEISSCVMAVQVEDNSVSTFVSARASTSESKIALPNTSTNVAGMDKSVRNLSSVLQQVEVVSSCDFTPPPEKKSQVSFVIMMNDHPCGLLGTDSTTNTWDVYTGGWWELTGSNASFTFTSFCRTEVSSQFTVGLQVVTGTTGGAWKYENCQYSARVKTIGSNDAYPIQSSIALLSTGRDGVSQSIVTTPSFSSVQGTYKKFSLNSPAFLDIFAICKFQPLSDLDPSNNFANAAEFAIALNDKICTLNGTAETKGRIPGTGLLSTLSARTSEQRGVFEVETICRQQVDSDFHLTIQARLLNFPQYNIIGCKYNVLQHPIYKGVKYQSQVVLPGTLTVSERSWMNLGNAVFPYAPGTRNLEVTALCDLRPLSNADHRSSQNQGAFRITINGEPCTLSGTKTDDINDNPTISSRANFGVSSITLHALCRKQILNDWLNVSWMNISLQGIDNSIPSKSWNYSSCAIGVRTEESPVLSTFVAARGLNTTIVPPNTSMNVAGMEKVITIPHGTKFTQQVEVMASCVAYPPQQLSQTSFAIMINGFPCGLLGLQSTSGGDWVSLWDIAVGSVTMTKICRTEVSSQVTVGLQVVTGTGGTWKFDNCQYNARVTNASCDSIPECKDMPPTTTAPSSTATITPPKVSSTPTCPPGWIIPGSGCIQCSVLDHCNNNSLSVTSDDERTKCVCRCKPSFVGPTCGQCSLGREDYPKCSCNKTALDCGSHCVDPLNVCSITGECDVWSHTCDWPSLDITLQMDWNAWTVQNTTAFISLIVKNMTSSVMTYPGNDIRVTARSGSVILTVALATLEQLKDFQNNVTTLVATGDLAGYGSVAIQLPHAGPVDVQTLSDNNTFAYLALIILFVPLLVFLHYCRARRAADKMKALANEMSTTTNMETLYREATVLYNSYANCKFWTKTIAELRRHYERILIAILAHSADSYLYKEMCYAMRMNDEFKIDFYSDFIDFLKNAMDKAPTVQSTTVYRGIDSHVHDDPSYTVGKTITWPSFSSAAESVREALKYVGVLDTTVPRCGTLFEITHKNAKSLRYLSHRPQEEVALFKPNSKFHVEKVVSGLAVDHVYLKEV